MGKYFIIPLLLWAQIINTGPRRLPPSGPRPAPTIRCSSQYSSGAGAPSSIAIPICGSAQAGDFTVLFAAAAYSISATGGWSTVVLDNGHTYPNLYVATKALSSGDISTGTITVSAGGPFDMPGALVTFIGATSGVREHQESGFQSTSPWPLTTTGAVQSTDVGLYFITDNSSPPSITPGAGVGTTLQTISTTNTKSLLVDQYMAGGVQANSFIKGGLNFQAIQVIVIP